MSGLDRRKVQALSMDRPHVVILGAGASYAALPNGDKNGRTLPLMWNIVDRVGLGSLLDGAGISEHREDFEKLFSTLATSGQHNELVAEIERHVFGYFAMMELPDEPTLYDHLVLSLRDKDVIATFNWDPFLWQALNRNAHVCPMPRVLFLHGNTAIGYTEHDNQLLFGSVGRVSRKCGKVFEPGPLLFPVAEKDYQHDERIRRAWDDLRGELHAAYVVTIFGYSAPVTDVEAVALLKHGWGDRHDRQLEEIEIIDVKSDEVLHETWKPFIHSHHYRTTTSFYESTIGCSPRRSCEAMWAQLMDCVFIEKNPIPQAASWDELYEWFEVLLADERPKYPAWMEDRKGVPDETGSGTDRQHIADNWAARGFSCDLWTDPPSQRWEDFTHARDELVTVLEGDMEFEVEGQVHHPQPGEELLIPAGAVHSARNIGSTTARWLYGYRE